MDPEILTPAGLLAVGIDPQQMRRMIRAGDLIRLRRGAYRRGGELGPEDTHRLQIVATLPRLDGRAVVSHASAGVLHGLPVPNGALKRVSVTRDRVGKGSIARGLRVRGCPIEEDEIVVLNGTPVTSLARTVADLGRELDFDWAVGAADAALRLGLTKEALGVSIDRGARRPGNARARAMAAFADARAESVGESRSRVILARASVPTPALQYEVTWLGEFLGRSDFAWLDHGVLGEFDGVGKYLRDLRGAADDPADVVVREKRREDRLRGPGWLVVRWVWEELDHPSVLVRRVRGALASGPGRLIP